MIKGYVGKTQSYTPIEYIESSGTQYIDTGVVATETTKFVIDYQFLQINNSQVGCGNANNSTRFAISSGASYFNMAIGVAGDMTIASDTNRHTFTLDAPNKLATIDSTSATRNYSTLNSSYTIALFCRQNQYGTDFIHSGRLYSAQIYQSGTLTKNFIPAIDQDGVVCLYELVEGKFYYNQGTGTFSHPYYNTNEYDVIDYIESSGTQYIDTGIKANSTTRLEMTVLSFAHQSFAGGLFGGRTSNNSSDEYAFFDSGANYYRDKYGGSGLDFASSVTISSETLLIKDKNVTTVGSNKVTHSTKTFQGTYNLFLFVVNQNGGIISPSTARIRSCKIIDNGSVIRNLIAVKRKSDNMICMYDLIGKQFYTNAGTGAFIGGSVIGTDQPAPTLLTSVARKLLKGYVGVPASYTPVEYIESSGTQYIDTGFKPNQNTNMQIDFQYLGQNSQVSSATSICIAGARQVVASNKLVFWVEKATNKVALNYGTYDSGFIANTDCSQRTVLKNQGCSLLYNGTTVASSTSSNFTSTYNILLFGETSADGFVDLRGIEMKLYSFKIWDNDALVRDFIPVINQDNVACLYELIEGKFYFNAGGGTFTAGSTTGQSVSAGSFAREIIKGYVGVNGVAKPIYETMTPINYIQANGTQYIETGVNATQTLRSQMKLNMQAVTGDVVYGFSTSGDTNDYRLFNYQNQFWFDMPPSSGRISGGTWNNGADYNIEIGNFYVKNLDTGTTIISSSTRTFSQQSNTMKVFFSGYGSHYSKGKLYYLKIYDGNTLLRDFVPVLDGNGVPCLYDNVSQTFYYNQGTGTFLYG